MPEVGYGNDLLVSWRFRCGGNLVLLGLGTRRQVFSGGRKLNYIGTLWLAGGSGSIGSVGCSCSQSPVNLWLGVNYNYFNCLG